MMEYKYVILSRLPIVVAALAGLMSYGCDGSSGEATPDEATKKVTFYLEGMGEKLKLL